MGQAMISQQQPFIGPPVAAKTYSRHTRRSIKAKRSIFYYQLALIPPLHCYIFSWIKLRLSGLYG
ncbi:hypothetical protein ACSO1_21800 [Acinetobacter calcoaceticus]|nr:hypothetical protein ACSO1_21800 [Acinetobacter calcoaceticus]